MSELKKCINHPKRDAHQSISDVPYCSQCFEKGRSKIIADFAEKHPGQRIAFNTGYPSYKTVIEDKK